MDSVYLVSTTKRCGIDMNGIEIINDYARPEVYQALNEYSKKIKDVTHQQYASNLNWHPQIKSRYGTVLTYRVTDDKDSDIIPYIRELIAPAMRDGYHLHSAHFYYWEELSYIQWHNDYAYGGAMSYYLNEDWEKSDGGFFLGETDSGYIYGTRPIPNTAVVQYGGARHCTTPVTSGGKVRRSLQCWFEEDKS
jgi:hypothetical protein